MTATSQAPVYQAPRAAASDIPFGRLVQVEFRKSWNTRSGFWLLFTIGALVLIGELIAAIVTAVQDVDDVNLGTFATVAGVITQLLLPTLGILLVTSEWSQRTAMVTFSLEPRRSRVVQAKLVVSMIWTAITVIFALAMGAVFNLLYGAINGSISWSGGAGIIGFVITQALAMLIGFAFASLMLNSPAALVVYVAYLFVIPTIFGIGAALMHWFKSLRDWILLTQSEQPLYDGFWHMSATEWGRFLVSVAIWVVLPLVFGLRRILRAEVK